MNIATANAFEHPCGRCEQPGGFYDRLCWECYVKAHPAVLRHQNRSDASEPAWITFRRAVTDALVRDGVFHYIDADRCAGRCPLCRSAMGMQFQGHTTAATFFCGAGCDELEIALTLRRWS